MAQEYAKRFVTKDGNTRITIYCDEYAENPRYNTDEPLHCEDWSRDYTIMNKNERDTKSHDALGLIRYLLERYGNTKAIIEVLRENAKADNHHEDDNALMYDASRHVWTLNTWVEKWTDYSGEIHGNKWEEDVAWAIKLKDLEAFDIVSYLSDDMIEEFADIKYFTDGVKIAAYGFGYNGDVSFYDEFSTDSEGICWLEKDEFLKYSGCDEKYWKSKTLTEIEWLCKGIEAWADNEVYGFVVEDAVRIQGIKTYYNGVREDEPYIETQWEESDSCWGFYGELDDEQIGYILDSAGYKLEELDEVA